MFAIYHPAPVVIYTDVIMFRNNTIGTEFIIWYEPQDEQQGIHFHASIPNKPCINLHIPHGSKRMRLPKGAYVDCVTPSAFDNYDTKEAQETFLNWTVFCGQLPEELDGLVHEFLFGRPPGNMMKPPASTERWGCVVS